MQSNESDVPRASDIFAELPVTENWAESMNGRNSSLIGQQPMPMSARQESQDSSNIQMEMKPLDNKKRNGSGNKSTVDGSEESGEFRQM